MIKVAVIPERYGAVLSPCGTIRLSAFFDRLKKEGERFEVRYLLLPELKKYDADVIVWQRVALPALGEIKALSAIAEHSGARLIYDLDDNLLDVAEHGEGQTYAAMIAAVQASLGVAHEVWVTTSKLAERISGSVAGSVVVLPNALDPELWATSPANDIRRAGAQPLRMLYMGTRTHDQDFRLLEAALEQLHCTRAGKFELTVIGVCAEKLAMHPWLRALNPPSHVGASYPAFVHWFSRLQDFDLGLAPLVAGRFNDCKSSIKVLDYAALGLPALASDVDAYRDESLKESHNVFLVQNTPEAWAERISALMAAPESLHKVRSMAQRLVAPEEFLAAVDHRKARVVEQFGLAPKRKIQSPFTAD